jgi:hypothetical protein
MTRGDTFVIDVAITDKNGVVDLTGKSLIFTLKSKVSDADNAAVAQKKSAGSAGIVISSPFNAGLATITLLPADTRGLSDNWQLLLWDLQLVDGSNIYTVATGELEVTPDITISTS